MFLFLVIWRPVARCWLQYPLLHVVLMVSLAYLCAPSLLQCVHFSARGVLGTRQSAQYAEMSCNIYVISVMNAGWRVWRWSAPTGRRDADSRENWDILHSTEALTVRWKLFLVQEVARRALHEVIWRNMVKPALRGPTSAHSASLKAPLLRSLEYTSLFVKSSV